MRPIIWLVGALLLAPGAEDLAEQARSGMRKATGFFESISVHGGYAGIYSLDLKRRYGEALYEAAKPTEIWVQQPGTPSVGEAFLRARRATGEQRYYRAARNAALALAWAQRAAGGWDHRCDVSHLEPQAAEVVRRKGRCTFDDEISQGALSFLMSFDQVADEPWLTEAVELAWKHHRQAQFPNGGWPQWYPLRGGYHDHFTFNDGTINDCIAVMLRAWRLYARKELLESSRRGGDFIILSQLPAPQSGWAQQYSYDLKPAKARSFEPAGVCSAVTARNIRTLVDLYLATDDAKYLRPIPRAVAWLERLKLRPNLWARLYEVGTNRPIYGDRDGKVHYTLEEISQERRTGYSWQGSYGIAGAIAYYGKVRRLGAKAYLAQRSVRPSAASRERRVRSLAPRVRKVLADLDEQGRWVRNGMIHCADFVRNVHTLCEYLERVAPSRSRSPLRPQASGDAKTGPRMADERKRSRERMALPCILGPDRRKLPTDARRDSHESCPAFENCTGVSRLE